MRIKCLTTFLDGTDRFEIDDERSVSDDRGAYFVANGWAEDLSGSVATGQPADGSADLDVQSSKLSAGDNHV
jgi:hypothetical protein